MSQAEYSIILSENTFERIGAYASHLRGGERSGAYLAQSLKGIDLEALDSRTLLATLLNSKKPQIFAESAVMGDGSDWTLDELGILGDISVGMTVTIYDNGAHQNPAVHETPFTGHLIYTPGALLRNDQGYAPADWQAVTVEGEYNRDKYYKLYERRLLPAFDYINEKAIRRGSPAFITIPGIGCGQFAGPFRGQMGHVLQAALVRFLDNHGDKFSGIKAVYYDPYNECIDEDRLLSGIRFIVRPLLPNNEGRSQLCRPAFLGQDTQDNFDDCELYSFVAWDHVSWPGNDYYVGSRTTDDGVKAAATNTMEVMTGIEGRYCVDTQKYLAPEPFGNWYAVVKRNNLEISIEDNLYVV